MYNYATAYFRDGKRILRMMASEFGSTYRREAERKGGREEREGQRGGKRDGEREGDSKRERIDDILCFISFESM